VRKSVSVRAELHQIFLGTWIKLSGPPPSFLSEILE